MLLLEVFMFFVIIWIISFIIIVVFDFNFNKFEVGKINLDLDVIFRKKNSFFNLTTEFFTKKREIKLKDNNFNEKFFISTDDKVLKEILENTIIKNAIMEIMNNEKIYNLEIKNKKINITVIVKKGEKRKDIKGMIEFQIKDCIKKIEEELNKLSVDLLPRSYRANRKLINSKIDYLNKFYYSLTIATIITFFIFSQKTDLYFMENEGISNFTYVIISYLISLCIVIALYQKNKKLFINSIKTYRLLLSNILGFISIGVLIMFAIFLINIEFDYSEKETKLIVYDLLKERNGKTSYHYIVIKKEDNPNIDLFKDEVTYLNINSISYIDIRNKGEYKVKGYITKGNGLFNKKYIKFE